jgi:hypothetical protein
MYAGTTIGNHSGMILGAHQRIDRIARRHLTKLLTEKQLFPTKDQILYFEGNNGPDGIKRKSPSADEPWHFINPKNLADRSLLDIINDHQYNLSKALKEGNQERAAFEAAWMSHAIVDGLTPAHHYPLAEKIHELFGKPHYERLSVREKNIIKGKGVRDSIAKNWEYWGAKGIFSNHAFFEWGVATVILGHRFSQDIISERDLAFMKKQGYEATFLRILHQIASLQTYEIFEKEGWTVDLSRTVRRELVPLIAKAVCLGWYAALLESEK